MVVKRIDCRTHILSIGTNYCQIKSTIRENYVNDSRLNIYHPGKGNIVIEELMDNVISNRSIPLDDGIETLIAIKEKYPFLKKYAEGYIQILKKYKKMI